MKVLVDTNILLRAAQRTHLLSADAIQATNELVNRGEELICVPQVCYEFWVVATRPETANGLGLSSSAADTELQKLQQSMTFLNDTSFLFGQWHTLVKQHAILGKKAHDARLVAAMKTHLITHLLTLNAQDFQGFPGITVLTPTDILSPTTP